MEEQIFEIMEHNGNLKTRAAKEITSHVMEFIMWLVSKDSKYAIAYGSDKPFCTTYEDFTIEEVYQYWLKEVKQIETNK